MKVTCMFTVVLLAVNKIFVLFKASKQRSVSTCSAKIIFRLTRPICTRSIDIFVNITVTSYHKFHKAK